MAKEVEPRIFVNVQLNGTFINIRYDGDAASWTDIRTLLNKLVDVAEVATPPVEKSAPSEGVER